MTHWKSKLYKFSRILQVRTRTVRRSLRKSWLSLRSEGASHGIEARPLRLELLSLEQLHDHARSLAAKHEIGSGHTPDKLLLRLAANESSLSVAYDQLSTAIHLKKRISPAGEWLLDNFHLIEEQIRTARQHLPKGYSQELPFLANTPSANYPRVYDIALEVIAHVDGRVDKENITRFIDGYQQLSPLKLGEFWAIPIMLRLALIENLRRVANLVVHGMEDREKANEWADKLLEAAESEPRSLILVAADMARSNPPLSNAFVAEFVRRLHGEGPALDIPLSWIEQELVQRGQTTQQTVQVESQEQAANQVSVGASIGSLRFLSAMDWRDFVESMSVVEKELMRDPAGVYPKMDFVTRDRYRHVIERFAKKTGVSELEVARAATQLAVPHTVETSAAESDRANHVGYFLVDNGVSQLETAVNNSRTLGTRFSYRFRLLAYFGSIGLITVGITVIVGALYGSRRNPAPAAFDDRYLLAVIALALLICASQVAVAIVNWLSTILVKPRLLSRLDFSKRIPDDSRTMVVIPTLLISPKNIDSLLDALEVRYLANRNENLHFALLTDFADSSSALMPADERLVERARAGRRVTALGREHLQRQPRGRRLVGGRVGERGV